MNEAYPIEKLAVYHDHKGKKILKITRVYTSRVHWKMFDNNYDALLEGEKTAPSYCSSWDLLQRLMDEDWKLMYREVYREAGRRLYE